MKVGSLEIELLANMARLQKDMDQAKRSVGNAMGYIDKTVGVAKAAIAGLASGLTVGAFANMVKASIDAADKLGDLSKSTNIAVEDLAGLNLAAQQSGTDLDGVARAVNKLSVEMGKDADKFAKVGITARDPIEALQQLANVYVSIEDPQQKAAFGASALGKEWASLAPLLAEGGTKIGEMVDKGKRLSGMTQEMVDQADKFNDELAELKVAVDGAATSIAGPLVTSINATIAEMTEATRIAGGFGNALMTFGLSSPFGTAAEQAAKYREEIEDLEKARLRYVKSNADTSAIDTALERAKKQLEFAKFRERAAMDYSNQNQSDAESRRLGLMSAPAAAPKGVAGFISKSDNKEAKQYESALKASQQYVESLRIETAQIGLNADQIKMMAAAREAAKAPTAALRNEIMEQALAFDIANKANADIEETMKRSAEAQAEMERVLKSVNEEAKRSVESATKEAEASEWLAQTFGKTRGEIEALELARLEEQLAQRGSVGLTLDEIKHLEELIAAKKRSVAAMAKVDQFEEQKKLAEESQKIWDNFTENVQRNMGDGLYDAMNGNFKNIGDSFKSMVQRMLADALAADLMNALMPGSRKGGGGAGGILSGIIGGIGAIAGGWGSWGASNAGFAASNGMSLGELAASFDGGGYTGNGPRSGGIDGIGGFPAIMHPQETVIDHSKGQSLGGEKSITISPTYQINIDSRTDRAEVQTLVSRAVKQGNAELVDQLQRAGRI